MIKMKDETKILIVAFVLPLLLAIFFKNIVHKPQDVVPLFLIPIFLWTGYITGKAGAKVWIGVTLFITVAMAILYAFF
jgi:hypothetical protein